MSFGQDGDLVFTSLERAGGVEAGGLAVTIKGIQCPAGLILLFLIGRYSQGGRPGPVEHRAD